MRFISTPSSCVTENYTNVAAAALATTRAESEVSVVRLGVACLSSFWHVNRYFRQSSSLSTVTSEMVWYTPSKLKKARALDNASVCICMSYTALNSFHIFLSDWKNKNYHSLPLGLICTAWVDPTCLEICGPLLGLIIQWLRLLFVSGSHAGLLPSYSWRRVSLFRWTCGVRAVGLCNK